MYHFLTLTRTDRSSCITPLPGQRLGSRPPLPVSEGIRVMPARRFEKKFADIRKTFPDGTVLATSSLKRKTIGAGTCYECADLAVLTASPRNLMESPTDGMLSAWNEYKQKNTL